MEIQTHVITGLLNKPTSYLQSLKLNLCKYRLIEDLSHGFETYFEVIKLLFTGSLPLMLMFFSQKFGGH